MPCDFAHCPQRGRSNQDTHLLEEYSFAKAWANDRTPDREAPYAAKFAFVLMAPRVPVKISVPFFPPPSARSVCPFWPKSILTTSLEKAIAPPTYVLRELMNSEWVSSRKGFCDGELARKKWSRSYHL